MQAVVTQFEAGVNSCTSLLNDLVRVADEERRNIEKQKQDMAAQVEAYAKEQHTLAQVFQDSQRVTLNVGGHKYSTTVATLRNAPTPSLFAAMFSGRHTLTPDESGCYFIDRDGRHFNDVLNFLRDGMWRAPMSIKDVEQPTWCKYLLELRAEAEFYGLTGLVEQIDRYPRAVLMASQEDDGWMYMDGPDEIVFSVSDRCQLLGAGLCGTEGAFTVEMELVEVDPKDFEHEISRLCRTMHTFTRSDGHTVRLYFPKAALLEPDKRYVLSANIQGSESGSCDDCLDEVAVSRGTEGAEGLKVTFYPHESPNGTTMDRGQFPLLLLRTITCSTHSSTTDAAAPLD